MGCKVGYPSEPCPFGFEGRVTRETCGNCKNFAPPRHILDHCMLWDRDGVLCKLPKSACATCLLYYTRPVGRPPGDGSVDWKDQEAVRAYQREQSAKHPEKARERMIRFLKKNPDYHKRRYAVNADSVKAAAKQRYHLKKDKKGVGEGEPGKS